MLDGGTDYMKTSVNQVPAKNVSIYNTAKWKTLRNFIIRSTMLLDENKKPTLKTGFVRLSSMSDEHLVNLKKYITELGIRKEMIEYIKKEKPNADCGEYIDEDISWFGEMLAKEVKK